MSQPRDDRWFLEQVVIEQARLRAFIRALGVRAEAVDDLAQDALLIAFEKRASFDPATTGGFGAWTRGIARKLVANALRKDARRQRFLSEHVSELLLENDANSLPPDRDLVVALDKCLEKLPSHIREVIHLRYFEELSAGAIGGRLDRSANDIRQALFRVRRVLLECLERGNAV